MDIPSRLPSLHRPRKCASQREYSAGDQQVALTTTQSTHSFALIVRFASVQRKIHPLPPQPSHTAFPSFAMTPIIYITPASYDQP